MQILTKDLLHTSTEDIWNMWVPGQNPPAVYNVMFDDGVELEMGAKQIIISRYIWDLHTLFPGMPIFSSHAFNDDKYGPTTHLNILSGAIFDAREWCINAMGDADMDYLAKVAYEITNNIYNDFSVKLERYVSTTNLRDYVEIVEHPEIKPKLDHLYGLMNPSPIVMEEAYSHVKKAMESTTMFPNNPIARAIRAGNTKPGSILQSIVARGTPTDIDSTVFKKTIKTGYLRGVNTLVDQIMDSRTSSKSLSYQTKPMQESEYLNRKLQLSGSTLWNIHNVDCGSKHYELITIKVGALKDYLGKFYYDESTGTDRAILTGDSHLQGRTLKMRTVFGCQHPDSYGVCVKCVGEIGYSLPKYTSVGQQFAINLQAPVGQLLLSDKHYVSTATGDGYVLSEIDRHYFDVDKLDRNILKFTNRFIPNSLKFRMMAQEVLGLNDVTPDINVDDLSIFRISEITFIEMSGENSLGREFFHEFITTSNAASRRLAFSYDVLKHVQTYGYTILNDGSYEIDLTHFDFSKPVLIMPRKQTSTVDFMKSIEKFTRGEGSKEMPSMVDYSSNIAALNAFHDIVGERMNVNISNLEVIMLAHSVRDIEAKDYRLPIDRTKAQLAKYNNIMNYRSLSAKMAYQGQAKVVFSESAFIIRDRPQHHLDPVMMGVSRNSVST